MKDKKTKNELEKLLNALIDALEESMTGVKIVEAALTQNYVMVFTFTFGPNSSEEVIYALSSEWRFLDFKELLILLVQKFAQVLPTPRSEYTYLSGKGH